MKRSTTWMVGMACAAALGMNMIGQGAASAEQETLTVMTNIVGEPAKVLENIAHDFMKAYPDITVEFSAPGKEYENIMKVKMASQDMPDVFSTHGWAIARYGTFLADLRDEPWAAQIDPSFKPIVTDKDGKVYVLPMDQDKGSPVYNVDVLKQFGIEVPMTMDELLTACETIKTKGKGSVSCIHIGGADDWPMGNIYDFLATPFLVSPEENAQQALLDGSFDWKQWTPLPALILDMHQKGYLNKDVLTAKFSDSAKAFAEGKTAFGFYGGYLIEEAKKTNPNVNGGLMPVPALARGDQPTFIGGEKTTWGIWKDTKHLDAAKKFLAFYARPENIKLVAEAQKLMPGLQGVKADIGYAGTYYEKYQSLRSFPYFDRVFLPNGMWDAMCKNGQELLAEGITAEEYSENMQKEFSRLFTVAKN